MNPPQRPSTPLPANGSHLFTVRGWVKDMGAGQLAWHGKVQHVLSGEAHYFSEWQALQAFLELHARSKPADVQD